MSGTLIYSAVNSLRFSPGNSLPQPKTTGLLRHKNARFPTGATSFRASAAQTLDAEPAVTASFRRQASSLYELLRVDETASLTEIKTAYRSLAKVHHPDASEESDGRDFIEIRKAYATLADPTTRAIYDSTLGARGRRVHAGAMGRASRVYTTTRWETDQCW
ncbi:Chaperone DnaJ-domain superfamily protein [Raphanus sativus]|uniref:Chaperone protein dnaJ 11, chloroplastic n=1 Tax=Raphanus sativus TaxID=3726 RepID=A0A6J0NXB4_RAPSA|nr:chaperone protein dnaJ 11, chloroplastic [Raphanus sativus]XP_056841953.1 chaperone protein dnaJ 11, chloroplastic-like [Raphanus sativus]XP_056853784.1 chaperone protein dnaJ 11, chloroplastic-like [Raphanus sativus]XP_056857904.1 chaperone protein dnaJ 11, chloroplastic-like [Raphanus sativus]KAJ4866155.1 Chaperone DnaJ-domain superfamily protein [Raphanus sativus]KAJ4870951.1 Chaperone DnaJ-domain superfamily protein [Raphanus sativus]KAJ4871338.1 Chaperone DnaJ-domain superfamily prote